MRIIVFLFFIIAPVFIQAQVKPHSDSILGMHAARPLPKEIAERHFYFKGFAIIINDDAADENNNHLLVGEIRALETEETNRDAGINKVFNLKGYCNDSPMGIVITTDKEYKVLQIAPSYIGKKVVYDAGTKTFTIGANFLDYISVGGNSFSAWQPVIVQIGLDLQGKTCFIKRNYSCFLDNFEMENNNILIFATSENPKIDDKNSEGAEMITVNTAKVHKDSAREWIPVADVLSDVETPYKEIGRMTLSEISKADDAYYFTTSNLDQFTLKSSNHLYQLKNNVLKETMDFPDYIKWNNEYSDWVNINGFWVDAQKEYVFFTHVAATRKQIVFSKTGLNLNMISSQKIPLNDYADFDKMLPLPDGNIVVLRINAVDTWSYFIYDTKMEVIKEVNSGISKKYYPNRLKALTGNMLECLFYIDNVNKKDCVLQTVELD